MFHWLRTGHRPNREYLGYDKYYFDLWSYYCVTCHPDLQGTLNADGTIIKTRRHDEQ